MRKLLTLATSFLLTLCTWAESSAIYKQPEGKVYDKVYLQIEGLVLPSWIGFKEGRLDGVAAKMVEDSQGNFYIQNLLASARLRTWAKLTKGEAGKYYLEVPQDAYEYGDDQVCTYNRMAQVNGQYQAPEKPARIAYSWDGTTLQLLGTSKEGDAIGVARKEDGTHYDLFGLVWKQSISLIAPSTIAPQSTTPVQQYTLSYKGLDKKRSVSVAIEGDRIFIKGFVVGYNPTTPLDNAWIQLERKGNKAIFTGPQYLGIASPEDFKYFSSDKNQYHTYAVARQAEGKYNSSPATTAEFDIDPNTGTISATGIIALSYGQLPADEADLVNTLRDLKLTPEGSLNPTQPAQPARPTLVTCYSAWNYEYTELTTKFMFHTEPKDIKGNFLPTDKLHYLIFVNGSTTPYTFARSKYPTLDGDKTEIPYLLTDPVGYTFGRTTDNETYVILTHTNSPEQLIKTIAVQIVYADGNTILKSEALEVPVKLPTAIATTSSPHQPTQIYQLNGQATQQLQPGINIVRLPNGTSQKMLR